MREEPESVGSKDDYQDNFEAWLAFQDNEELTKIAKEYVTYFVPHFEAIQEELAAGISEKFQLENFGELLKKQ